MVLQNTKCGFSLEGKNCKACRPKQTKHTRLGKQTNETNKLALNSRRRCFGSGAGQEPHEPLSDAALGAVLGVEEPWKIAMAPVNGVFQEELGPPRGYQRKPAGRLHAAIHSGSRRP